jgi:fatty acid desaturase
MSNTALATAVSRGARPLAAVEWPTLLLAGVIYGGWIALTLLHAVLPLWLLVPLAAWTVAWQSSLQHEVIHGHPFRNRAWNRAIGSVPLILWLPFARYRSLHLLHHRDERLTDPLDDPESYYLTPDAWARLTPLARVLVRAQTTLLGRLVIGPFWGPARFLFSEARLVARRNRGVARVWAHHLLLVALLFGWVWGVCGMAPLTYVAVFVVPGTALLLVRSFAEHRADRDVARRTAIVEGSTVFGLLFLNNNLHAAHHSDPTVPWYALPAWYRRHRGALIAANGGLVYDGYLDVARRYLLSPHDTAAHPHGRAVGTLVKGAPAVTEEPQRVLVAAEATAAA